MHTMIISRLSIYKVKLKKVEKKNYLSSILSLKQNTTPDGNNQTTIPSGLHQTRWDKTKCHPIWFSINQMEMEQTSHLV